MYSKLEYLESIDTSFDKAADTIIQKLKEKGVRKGQVISIDAHNNGNDQVDKMFTAQYSLDLPDKGSLNIEYHVQNAYQGWAAF